MRKGLPILHSLPSSILIPIAPKDIHIIQSPSDFYASVIHGISTATKRITIASLYINQTHHYPLVLLPSLLLNTQLNSLEEALKKTEELKIHILLDYLRGTRSSQNSLVLFETLLNKYPERIKLSLFHTPNLHGILKRIIPPRFNETLGLQHMKAYIFDDTAILSGANLNSEYFEKRQDRYVKFDSKQVSDYYDGIVECVGKISHTVVEGQIRPPAMTCKHEFKRSIESIGLSFQSTSTLDQTIPQSFIIPKLQMHSFGIQSDKTFMTHLLTQTATSTSPWSIRICSGYLNFPTSFRALILAQPNPVSILTSSPRANGFFLSKGVSRFIPTAYTYLTRIFLRSVRKNELVKVKEYGREGWTWHGKGVWLKCDDRAEPYIMVIGSSNYGKRSEMLDLECQCYLFTHDAELQARIEHNLDYLYSDSVEVSLDSLKDASRRVPLLVKLATHAIKKML